jgi:hypothetical protein
LEISKSLPVPEQRESRVQPLSQRRKSLRQQQSVQAAIQKAAGARDDQLAQLEQRIVRLEQKVGLEQLEREFAEAERDWQKERRRLLDELERTGQLLKQARAELETDRRDAPQALEGLSEQSDPMSSDEEEVFARLRAMSLLKEASEAAQEDGRIESSAYESANTNGQPARRKSDAGSDEPHEHEISIDDYMARLLKRSGGASANPARQAAKVDAVGERSFGRAELVKMEPRAKAPEASIGLAVMREIANESARAAISTHHVRHHETRARRMKDFSMVAAALAALLLFLSEALGRGLFISGLIAALVAVCLFVRTAIRERRSRLLETELDEPEEGAAAGYRARGADFPAIEPSEECSPAVETAMS